MKKYTFIIHSVFLVVILLSSCSSGTNSSDSDTSSPNGTYTITTKMGKYGVGTINVVVNGEKWTSITEMSFGNKKTNDFGSGLVSNGYLFKDEYNKHRGKDYSVGKINEDGTLTFKDLTLTK